MKKFFVGLLLGVGICFFAFRYQVHRVDEFSFRVGYMSGRVDQSNYDPEVLDRACFLYHKHDMGNFPYGYTPSHSDQVLKEICQNQ